MAWAMQCPFWKWTRNGKCACEAGQIQFVDEAEMEDYFSRHCAAHPGWQECSLAKMLARSYERDAR